MSDIAKINMIYNMYVNRSSGLERNLEEFVVLNVCPLFPMLAPITFDLWVYLALKYFNEFLSLVLCHEQDI